MIQFLLLLVLFLAALLTWRRFRQHAIGLIEAFAWTLVWGIAAIFVIRPDTTTRLAHLVGVGRGADLVLYASVIALLILVFQLHVAHQRLERSLTELIRAQALKEWDEKTKEGKE